MRDEAKALELQALLPVLGPPSSVRAFTSVRRPGKPGRSGRAFR